MHRNTPVAKYSLQMSRSNSIESIASTNESEHHPSIQSFQNIQLPLSPLQEVSEPGTPYQTEAVAFSPNSSDSEHSIWGDEDMLPARQIMIEFKKLPERQKLQAMLKLRNDQLDNNENPISIEGAHQLALRLLEKHPLRRFKNLSPLKFNFRLSYFQDCNKLRFMTYFEEYYDTRTHRHQE